MKISLATTLISGLWLGLLVTAVLRFRPTKVRALSYRGGHRSSHREMGGSDGEMGKVAPEASNGVFWRIGTRVQARCPMLTELPSAGVGLVTVVGAALLPWAPLWAFVGATVALGVLWAQKRSAVRRNERATVAEFGFVLQLLAQSLRSGLTARQSISVLEVHSKGTVRAAMSKANTRLVRGETLASAIEELDLGLSGASNMVSAVKSSDATGAPLAPAIARLSDSVLIENALAAQERARQLPVKLLLPLAAFFLPAFVLIAVVPVFLSGISAYSFP